MKKTNSKNIEKNSSNLNDIKLPKIKENNKQIINRNDKVLSNYKRYSSTSKVSKKSIENKPIINNNNNTINEQKTNILKRNTIKINDIINNVNKSHNINSQIINNNNKLESLSSNNNQEKKKRQIYNLKSNYKLIFKKKNIKINEDSLNTNNIKKIDVPRITKEKLKEIHERRRIRLIREKKEFEMSYKLLNEKKENNDNSIIKKENEFSNSINSPIEISQKKAQKILEEGGMIDAYKYIIAHLCKNGMPPGNLYEYCSLLIKNYEKEWKKKKYKIINDKIQKYFENKKNLLSSNKNNNDNLLYKVIEKREDNQFIKKLDKSRSTIRIIKRNPIIKDIIKKNNNNKNYKTYKSNSFERNKNKNELMKINPDNIILNSNQNNNDDKKVYFNIQLKNNENKKDKNENIKTNNSSKKNNNNINITNNIDNYKIIKTNKSNSKMIIKKESINIKNIEGVNKTNNNNFKNKKEEINNEKINSSKNNFSKFKNNKSNK